MASDETPVERRLRELWEEYHGQREDAQITVAINPGLDDETRRHYHNYADLRAEQSDAIDCGREAIRLLRAWDDIPHNGDLKAWMRDRVALLARCTEGPR